MTHGGQKWKNMTEKLIYRREIGNKKVYTKGNYEIQEETDKPASVAVCLKARTWESDKPVRREMTLSMRYWS